MSLDAMLRVWNHSTMTENARLVLLAIADHDGEGGAFPSIATLARYANCSESAVHRAISRAVAAGELSVIPHGGGGADCPPDRRPNLYRVLAGVPVATPHGVPVAGERGAGGDTNGVPVATPEPPMNPHGTALAAPGARDDGQESLIGVVEPPVVKRERRDRRTTLPDGWKVAGETIQWTIDRLPDADIDAVYEAFCGYHTARGSVMADWDAAWRNWVRRERADLDRRAAARAAARR